MAKSFHLTIAKVGENLFAGEALSVTVPGSAGTLTVLAQHEPLVTPLVPGIITVTSATGVVEAIPLEGAGVLEVSNSQATIII